MNNLGVLTRYTLILLRALTTRPVSAAIVNANPFSSVSKVFFQISFIIPIAIRTNISNQ